jgi:hypothetical protein
MPGLVHKRYKITGTPWKAQAGGGITEPPPESRVELELEKYIPEIHRGNSDFRKFFSIIEDLYLAKLAFGNNLDKLMWYDECPAQYIYRLAQYLSIPYYHRLTEITSDKERRTLLKNAAWIWKRKGTKAALEKIFEILGFYSYMEEEVKEDFIIGFHNIYGLGDRTADIFTDNFNDGTADGWEKQLAGSTWEVVSSRYYGTGDGTNNRGNCSVILNPFNPLYMQVDFQVIGGSGSMHPNFGVYLAYVTTGTNLGIHFYTSGATDYLYVSGFYSGFEIIGETYDITGKVDYKSGVHTLKVHYFNNKISVAIDDTTLITPLSVGWLHILWPLLHKGLYVNQSTQVAFDNVEIRRLKTMDCPLMPGDDPMGRTLRIWLYGAPDNAAAKKEYLQDVIPKYFVPACVQVVWE